ncbi:secretion protein [Nocardia speluncae]|uniref:Secretion protein n=1 Tax=Nocardia speluncae TaxID=419477 RepID=A0A846XKF3_9NOCA|nr:CAP family protein [Nocardia speluncae]NKY35063.1 secretion protein [Nocardia speluncae]
MRFGRLVSAIAAVMLAALVTGGGPAAGQSDFTQTGLTAHNKHRAQHGSPAMTPAQDLNDLAQKCAEYYADKGTIDHTCPHKNGAGENLTMGTGAPSAVTHVETAVQMWYDEVADYNYDNPGFSLTTGHFTQVVWKASTRLGIGYVAKDNRFVVVALYDPPGNMKGQFPQNVAPPN